MSLPMAHLPTYEITIPSTGDKVKYRPFLVKEEKSLLIAQQSEDLSTMLDTLRNVISSCTFGKLNIEDLAIFDIEYLFTQIRAKSVGEIIELVFRCQHCDDQKAKMNINIDLTKIDVKKSEEHTNKIQLFGDVGVVMKYPSVEYMKELETNGINNVDLLFNIIRESINFIYSGDEIFHAKEQTKEELDAFINNLTQEQFIKIQKFFETMPKMTYTVEFNCPVCGEHNSTTLEGLQSFF